MGLKVVYMKYLSKEKMKTSKKIGNTVIEVKPSHPKKNSYYYMYSANQVNSYNGNLKVKISGDGGLCLRGRFNNVRWKIAIYNNSGISDRMPDRAKRKNLERLYDIAQLGDNWDGYGNGSISEKVVLTAEKLIRTVPRQPEIYPTGRNSIQLQYELPDTSYLEFEIFEEKIVCMEVPERIYSRASFQILEETDTVKIGQIVEGFYAKGNTKERISVQGSETVKAGLAGK